MEIVILIGRINKGQLPIGGETAKNQNLIAELRKYCEVIELDFYQNKKHPWIFLRTLYTILRYPSAPIILSTTASNIYPLLKCFKSLGIKRHLIHWIVGGEFDKLVEDGKFDVDVLNIVSYHLAQSHAMVDKLRKCGVTNVEYIPNFRQINAFPDIETSISIRERCDKIKFVFLSRIMKVKGVEDILHCARRLNGDGLQEKFSIDFYGRMDEVYKEEFNAQIRPLPNVKYNGVLDLRGKDGYEKLALYHAMLFPTYHPSEGVAGVIIDAYVAGLPVIASDWGHNREIIEDGVSGIIVPAHNVDVLYTTMKDIIEKKRKLTHIALGARNMLSQYRAENVINEMFLEHIGVLSV